MKTVSIGFDSVIRNGRFKGGLIEGQRQKVEDFIMVGQDDSYVDLALRPKNLLTIEINFSDSCI